MKLKTLQNTVFKLEPVQASDLPADKKEEITAGQLFDLHSYKAEGKHIKVAFENVQFKGRNTWYAFADHVRLVTSQEDVVATQQQLSPPTPGELPRQYRVKDFPYFAQTDNRYNPSGSCNVTSVAMCLSYFGAKPTREAQLEDEYYDFLIEQRRSRHDPYDLKWLVEQKGYKDDFRETASVEDVKKWIAQDKPVIVHGYFTRFGHIIVLVGYNAEGFIVHDPYGEYWDSGYDMNTDWAPTKGKGLVYSYSLIERTCSPEGPGNMWCHFISK